MNAEAHQHTTKKAPDLTPPVKGSNGAQRVEATATKEAKPAKAPKAPKEPRAPRESALRRQYPDAARIVVLSEKNPKRAGSKSFARFELYTANKTVGEFIKAGGLYADLSWDVGHGFVKVEA